MPSYKLVYFNSRARGEVARLLFTLADVEFTDERIVYGSEEWLNLKPDAPLGQLPYLEVDGKKLVQSKAIFRYIAREFGFYGKTNWECSQIDAIMDTCEQLIGSLVPILRSEETEKAKLQQTYRDGVLTTVLNFLESCVPAQKKYFMENKMTVADLIAYCDIEFASIVADVPINDLLKNYPKLAAMRELVESDERIARWIKTRPKTFL